MSEGYDGLPAYYSQSADPVTPNLGLSLKGMDPIIARNFVTLDSSGGGSTVQVNSVQINNPNFNNATPAAPTGYINAVWQSDVSGNVSAYVSLSSLGLDIATAGQASPTPAYLYNEAPSTINSAVYVQDINGKWHPQAGVDTNTTNSGFPPSGPSGPAGTLTWTRRQYYRSNTAPKQTFQNAFMSINHAAGAGTEQTNQDRALAIGYQNATATINGVTIASGIVTFRVATSTVGIAPGMVFTPTGLSTVTQVNNMPFTVQSTTATTIVTIPAPFALTVANNASAGSTVYAGYINRAAGALIGQTLVVAGFSSSANNGTFTASASTSNSVTVNNPSGVLETATGLATATATYSNIALTSDTGMLDQVMYAMEGIQCEIDLFGTPTFTGTPDGECTTFSGQMALMNTGAVTTPAKGFNILRASLFKSGNGALTGATYVAAAVNAELAINNPTPCGGAGFIGVSSIVHDVFGGAAGAFGHGFHAYFNPASTTRLAQGNVGLYIEDYSNGYLATSVGNDGGGVFQYNGTFATTNALAGQRCVVTGAQNAGNNGVFTIANNTSARIVVTNASGVAESGSSIKVQMLSDYAIYVVGGQSYLGGTLQLVGTFADGTGAVGTNGQVLSSTGTSTLWKAPPSGSVTSVAMTGDGVIFNSTVTGSPITTSGTLVPVLLTQTANQVLAGPTTGAAATPTFRALVTNDIPTGIVTWDRIGSAAGNLTLANAGFSTTFNQTSSVAWTWANTTTATLTTLNSSPPLQLQANYWTGSASAIDNWFLYSHLTAGTNGVSTLGIGHAGSTGNSYLSLQSVGLQMASGAPYGIDFGTTSAWTLPFSSASGTVSCGSISFNGSNNLLYSAPTGARITQQGSISTTASACTTLNNSVSLTGTSGTQTIANVVAIFAPTSGSATFVGLQVSPTVNQTSSASGSYIAMKVSVTETALLGSANKFFLCQGGSGGSTSEYEINNSGIVDIYNGVATVRNGQPAEYASADSVSQSAAIAATTILSTPQTGAYRISWSADITTAASGSSVLGGTAGFQVVYTSPTDSVVKTTVSGNSVTSTANTIGTAIGGTLVVYAKTGTNLKYSFDYTSVGVTAMVYELHVTVEAL